jgi:sulfite reductase alpha subunit-like flavoprotein
MYEEVNIRSIKRLHCTWREVYRIKFDRIVDYIPGDSMELLCPNRPEHVEELFGVLNLKDGNYRIIKSGRGGFTYEGSLKDFFKYKLDILSIPKKSLLYDLSQTCTDDLLKRKLEYLCSKEGVGDYFGIHKRWNNLLDIIYTFNCKPTFEMLIEHCGIIRPRCFSLINRRNEEMEILCGIMKNEEENARYGHCSGFFKFYNPKLKDKLSMCIRENRLLRMKESERSLLIATGVGIAPFISFINNSKPEQEMWMIYGHRHSEDDLSSDIKGHVKLSKVESGKGKRITDYIEENTEEIRQYIQGGSCYVYICGSPNMQKDVIDIFKRTNLNPTTLLLDNWS